MELPVNFKQSFYRLNVIVISFLYDLKQSSAQFLIGAIVSGISAQFHSEAFWPMSVTMLVASALAFTAVPSPSRFARQVALEGGAQ